MHYIIFRVNDFSFMHTTYYLVCTTYYHVRTTKYIVITTYYISCARLIISCARYDILYARHNLSHKATVILHVGQRQITRAAVNNRKSISLALFNSSTCEHEARLTKHL